MIPKDTICSVCGIARNQPSPLCGAYAHPERPKIMILPDRWEVTLPFIQRIKRMNQIFEIGAPSQLTNLGLSRLHQFQEIISDEVSEGKDLIQQIITRSLDEGSLDSHQQLTQDEMVAFADWLGDLVVYVFSEAARWGIDLLAVLGAIMDSQDSKLGPDGKPIHDPVTHKFLKGPNYVAPEAAIKALMFPSVTDGLGPSTGSIGPAIPYVQLSNDVAPPPPEKFECPHCGYRENRWIQDGATYFCSRCLMHVKSRDLRNNSEKSCGGVDFPTDKP